MDLKRILYSNISFNGHHKRDKQINITTNGTTATTSNNLKLLSNLNQTNTPASCNGNENGIAKHLQPNGNSSNSTSSSSINNLNGHNNHQNSKNLQNGIHDEYQLPKHPLCDPRLVKLNWLQADKVGGGLINVGNTCFLNSVLQCLTYCPPLYNFLVKSNGGHSQSCKLNQFCMLCEMEKHVKRIRASNGSAIKPMSIVQRLKYINRSFQFGRQEDAHEFLRFVIDHMWKACLMNLDISVKTPSSNGNGISNGGAKIDARVKETTHINHIFGGYHRSQVLCLSCNTRSNTYDYFMDLMLDIRNAKSLEEALKRFTQPETLENENAYKCSKCRKMVKAKKKFTIYKVPNVATFQFKRFDSDRIFGGKVTKFISYPEELDMRPYMSDPNNDEVSTKYQLSAVLVHVGHSSNSGHYFCFIKNSNNFWYRMDDSTVSLVTQNTVLQQQAYVLFYTRKVTTDTEYPSNCIAKTLNSTSTFTSSANTIKADKLNSSNNQASKIKNTATNNINNTSSNANISNNNCNDTNIFSNNNNNLTTSASTNVKLSNPDEEKNKTKPEFKPFTTWFGSKSNLAEPLKRRLEDTQTSRDKFNEELDQGKLKKVKFQSRKIDSTKAKNSFQRFASNGYKQYKNNGYNNHTNNHSSNNHYGSNSSLQNSGNKKLSKRGLTFGSPSKWAHRKFKKNSFDSSRGSSAFDKVNHGNRGAKDHNNKFSYH